jgi:hypothetical protein
LLGAPVETGDHHTPRNLRHRHTNLPVLLPACKERIARSLALLAWTRQMIARRIIAERGEMSEERLKWEVAFQLYGGDPTVCRMIESELADVSG